MMTPIFGQTITICRQVYRGPLPRFDRSGAKLIRFSKDPYYPLDRQDPVYVQAYAVRENVTEEALAPYVVLFSI